MKKIGVLVLLILIAVGIVSILLYNKSKNDALAKSSELIAAFPVTVAEVKNEKYEETLSMVGTINPNAEVTVLSETQGKVIAVYVNIGDHVSRGTVIAKVDDEIKKATLDNAEANFEKAKKDLERYEKLNKEKSVNDVQLEQSKLTYKITESQYIIAKRQLSDTKITSEATGVITARMVEVGTVVGNNTPVATIVDIATLKLKVNVAEKDVFQLKVGESVDVTTDVYPDMKFPGKIKNINSKGDEGHTYPVEITMQNNAKNPLKAGMFARVYFNTVKRESALVIARAALVGSIREPQVYKVENNIAKLCKIVIGNDFGDKLEVNDGLKQGDVIVVNGQYNLQDNVQVTIIK